MKYKIPVGIIGLTAMALLLAGCGTQSDTVPSEMAEAPASDPTPTEVVVSTPTPVDEANAPTSEPTATGQVEAQTVVDEPTATPEPLPTPTDEVIVEVVDWLTVESRTENDLPALGNPDASVTVIDYSDFL